MVVVVVVVVTDTRHYHNCESQQPAITSGESGSMLSTAGYKVVTTRTLSVNIRSVHYNECQPKL